MGLAEVGRKADEAAGDSSPSTFLLGATATVAGVFATLQITGDLFTRMLANHPNWVGAAMICAGGATALSLVALILGEWFTKGLLTLGVVLFLAGTTLAVIAALLVASDRGKPIVAITKLEERELEVSVKLSNLKTRETLRVRVEPLRVQPRNSGGIRYQPLASLGSLHEAAFGPDAKGNVDQTISVDLPAIDFSHVGVRAWVGRDDDCYSEASETTSCVTREVVRWQERPQLTATWNLAAEEARLTLRVSAQGLRRTGYAYLRARPGGGGDELASWALAASTTGSFERTLEIQIPSSVRSVCVETSMIRMPAAACKSGGQTEMSWVRLAVPVSQSDKP